MTTEDRAKQYVTSRWGQRPHDERDRLASAYVAGTKASAEPDPGVAESGLGVGEPVTKDMSAREPTAEERESLAASEVAMTKAEAAVQEQLMERAAVFQGLGGNSGHGHVVPRPDGVKARCGGPGICAECSSEAARTYSPPTTVPANPEPIPDQVLTPLSEGDEMQRRGVARLAAFDAHRAATVSRAHMSECNYQDFIEGYDHAMSTREAVEAAIRAPLDARIAALETASQETIAAYDEGGSLVELKDVIHDLRAALAGVPKEAGE